MNFTQDVNYIAMNHLEESIINGKPEGLKKLVNWDTVYLGLSELPEKIKKKIGLTSTIIIPIIPFWK